ncbi:MAG TPA: hypothetical protein VGL95_00175 [Acetobacteraceae bacterium]
MASFLSYLIEAAYPDANRDGTATSEPYRTLHLLGLIRTIIDYGKQLIVAARHRAGTADFLPFAAPFGTASLKLLLARIGCAISRAVHLEQKLQYEAGLGGCYRPEAARPAPDRRAPRARSAAAARSHDARSHTGRTGPAEDPDLAHLPSVAQIAAEIRRLPLQQVIATICRDLGITPDHVLWQQLNQALAGFGVSLPVPVSEHDPAWPRPLPLEPGAAEQGADTPRAQTSAAPAQPPPPIAVRQAAAPPCTGPPVSADNRTAA